MFDSIQSLSNGEGQTHAIVDCYNVRYVVYFDSDGVFSEVNTYIVHLDRCGLIRRDTCPLNPRFDWGGPTVQIYKGAK